MNRILLVDDEPNILNSLKRLLMGKMTVDCTTSAKEALKRAQQGVAYDLVISDYRMPEMDGVVFLSEFRKIQPDCARLILSGYADMSALIGAINEAGIIRFISKPWNDADLIAAVNQAIEHKQLLQENRRLADQVRMQQGLISRQELELRRLEEASPGITKVKWGEDGSIIIDDH